MSYYVKLYVMFVFSIFFFALRYAQAQWCSLLS